MSLYCIHTYIFKKFLLTLFGKNIFENVSDSSKLTWDKKLIKEDLDNTLELLNNYEKLYNDIKVTYDCILYPTESGWQAVIDTTEKV